MAYKTVNPYNGETLATFDELSGDELEQALAAGR